MMAPGLVKTRQSAVALSLALSFLTLAGCASSQVGLNTEKKASGFRDPGLSMQSARDAVVVGTSTRAEVLAALGPATVVNFDSGFEVWVYRAAPSAAANTPAEFVILLTPEGVVKKTRVRPPYAKPAP